MTLTVLAVVAVVGAIIGVIAGGIWYGLNEQGEFSIAKAMLWVVAGGVVGAITSMIIWTVGTALAPVAKWIGRVFSEGWRLTKFWPTLWKAIKGARLPWLLSFMGRLYKWVFQGDDLSIKDMVLDFVIIVAFGFVGSIAESGIAAVISKKMAKSLFSREIFGLSLARVARLLKDLRLRLLKYQWFKLIYDAKNVIGNQLRAFTHTLYTPWKFVIKVAQWGAAFVVDKIQSWSEALFRWVSGILTRR